MTRILLVTPAPPRSRHGNRVTALRWAQLLRSLGHRVRIDQLYREQPCDMLIALHARKCAATVQQFAAQQAGKPIILALTGTDLYRDIRSSRAARASMELATRLVLLQPHGLQELSPALHAKCRVIYQSATAPRRKPQPLENAFEICVSGHLRAVKDPFRSALAARHLPASSKIRITHLGAALSADMRRRAEREMQRNPRYRWLGGVPRWRAGQLLARSRLLVLTSRMEGGANVVSEALAAGVPVLSSRISGSIGLLGADYAGFFEVGDTQQLARLLYRCETDRRFYALLKSQCRARRFLTSPSLERASWQKLLAEVT